MRKRRGSFLKSKYLLVILTVICIALIGLTLTSVFVLVRKNRADRA